MACCKGIAVTSRVKYVQEHHGEAGLGALLEALPEDRPLLEAHVLPHAWVPMDVFIRVNVAADRLFGRGDLKLCQEMGAWAAERTLPTLFKLFFRLGTPMFVFNKASKLWSAHYDTGTMVAERHGDGPAHLFIRDFAQPHRAHCLSVLGWASKSVALSGAKLARAEEPRCRTHGAPECELVVEWR